MTSVYTILFFSRFLFSKKKKKKKKNKELIANNKFIPLIFKFLNEPGAQTQVKKKSGYTFCTWVSFFFVGVNSCVRMIANSPHPIVRGEGGHNVLSFFLVFSFFKKKPGINNIKRLLEFCVRSYISAWICPRSSH